eukprot:gene8954-9878_t
MAMQFLFLLQLSSLFLISQAEISLWPLPWSVTSGDKKITLDGQFSFTLKTTLSSNTILDSAMERYLQLIAVPKTATGSLKSCVLTVSETSIPQEVIGSDESYDLQVNTDSCTIQAATTWGMLRGLETFSQLLSRGGDNGSDVLVTSAPVTVTDKARYGHRGLLIDTARHYLPVSEIKRVISSMPMNKLNVLHWHVVDAESFPLDTPSEPTMVKGAFSPSMIYSMDDVKDITQYAFERGVEVIVEIDIPGHAAGWTKGKVSVMADCFAKYYYNINDFALNPTLDETYITIQHILGDVTKAANSHLIHLGGDEVVYGCWKNDSSIVAFMQANGIKSYDALLTYFVKIVDNNVLGTSQQIRSVIHWEEVFVANSNLPIASTIYQVWTDSSMISQLTGAGYRVIASPSNYWYLNIATNTWQVMYGYEPTSGLSQSQMNNIIGGEAALWSEYIDERNIESNLYPRTSAVAERLWSDSQQTLSATDALPRLLSQRCRLVNRGIQSAPVQPAGYCDTIYV